MRGVVSVLFTISPGPQHIVRESINIYERKERRKGRKQENEVKYVAVCWLSLIGMNRGYSLVVVHRLLTAMASLVVEHRL